MSVCKSVDSGRKMRCRVHSCTTRHAVSRTYRSGHACPANVYEATTVSIHLDTAAVCFSPENPV